MPLNTDDDAVYRPRTILRRTADKRLEALKAERRLELVPACPKPQAEDDDIAAKPRPGNRRPKR